MGTMVTAIRLAVLLHRIRRDGARRRETRHDRLSPCMCPGTVSRRSVTPHVGAPALLCADLRLIELPAIACRSQPCTVELCSQPQPFFSTMPRSYQPVARAAVHWKTYADRGSLLPYLMCAVGSNNTYCPCMAAVERLLASFPDLYWTHALLHLHSHAPCNIVDAWIQFRCTPEQSIEAQTTILKDSEGFRPRPWLPFHEPFESR